MRFGPKVLSITVYLYTEPHQLNSPYKREIEPLAVNHIHIFQSFKNIHERLMFLVAWNNEVD
jgi:hypothetical protein